MLFTDTGISGRRAAEGVDGDWSGDWSGDSWRGNSWAEAHVPGLGWIGFDPADGVRSTDRYVRVAIGLDYLGAAPVRGFHYGDVQEDVAVRLEVTRRPGRRRNSSCTAGLRQPR